MIRHLVLWTLHNPSDATYFKAQLDSCQNLVDGMVELETGIVSPNLEGNCHVALNSLFRDALALAAYHAHPHHVVVKSNLAPLSAARSVLDYVV